MKQIVTIARVRFLPYPEETEINTMRILGYLRAAARRGADWALFPAFSLEQDGAALQKIAAAAQEYGIWTVLGVVRNESGKQYAAAAVCTPEGETWFVTQRELTGKDAAQFCPGDGPKMFETPWGQFGVVLGADMFSDQGARAVIRLAPVGAADELLIYPADADHAPEMELETRTLTSRRRRNSGWKTDV